MDVDQRSGYLSYLLRMWRVRSEGEIVWRASLQSIGNDDHLVFPNFDDLLAYLIEKTKAAAIDPSNEDLLQLRADIQVELTIHPQEEPDHD